MIWETVRSIEEGSKAILKLEIFVSQHQHIRFTFFNRSLTSFNYVEIACKFQNIFFVISTKREEEELERENWL